MAYPWTFSARKGSPKEVEQELKVYSVLRSQQVTPYCHEQPPYADGSCLVSTFYKQHVPKLGKWLESFRLLIRHLQSLHTAGVVHQDLKPEHIRETVDGEIILIDFGEGFTVPYTSVDRILNRSPHFVDDLESAIWIARAWAGCNDWPKYARSEHQREWLKGLLDRFDSIEAQPKSPLKSHLFYIWSLCRVESLLPADVYQTLCDENLDFTLANVRDNLFSWISENVSWRQSTLPRYLEQLLLPVEGGAEINSVAVSSQDGRHLSESEYILWRSPQGKLSELNLNAIEQPINPYSPSDIQGNSVIIEVWSHEEAPIEELSHKFKVLPDGHRPLHTLLFCQQYLLVGGGIQLKDDTDEKEPCKAEDLLARFMPRPELYDLSVLLACGRLHILSVESLPVIDLSFLSSKTVFGLKLEIEKVQKRTEEIRRKTEEARQEREQHWEQEWEQKRQEREQEWEKEWEQKKEEADPELQQLKLDPELQQLKLENDNLRKKIAELEAAAAAQLEAAAAAAFPTHSEQ